jgi:hypothetical protein
MNSPPSVERRSPVSMFTPSLLNKIASAASRKLSTQVAEASLASVVSAMAQEPNIFHVQ